MRFASILGMLPTARPRRRRLRELGETPERVVRQYRRELADRSASHGWVHDLPDAEREAFREPGRQILGGVLGFLDAPTPTRGSLAEALTRRPATAAGPQPRRHPGARPTRSHVPPAVPPELGRSPSGAVQTTADLILAARGSSIDCSRCCETPRGEFWQGDPATIAERPTMAQDAVPAVASQRSPSVVAIVAHARTVPSLRREAFAAELATLGEGPGHLVVHTCHRVELYVAPGTFAGPLPEPPAGAQRLEDVAAVRHLISVACGLDSAVVGETQILHQLRGPIAQRGAGRALDPVLDRLFQVSLHAGRIAHGWFTGSPRSLADVALDRIAAAIGPLEGRRILVVGVGRMGRLAAFAAMRRGCSVGVTNRGEERAAQLAREVGGTVVGFGALGDAPDGVIVAIAGRWPVGSGEIDALRGRGVPLVDLSSPPALAADPGPARRALRLGGRPRRRRRPRRARPAAAREPGLQDRPRLLPLDPDARCGAGDPGRRRERRGPPAFRGRLAEPPSSVALGRGPWARRPD
jgi:hypothetical protein